MFTTNLVINQNSQLDDLFFVGLHGTPNQKAEVKAELAKRIVMVEQLEYLADLASWQWGMYHCATVDHSDFYQGKISYDVIDEMRKAWLDFSIEILDFLDQARNSIVPVYHDQLPALPIFFDELLAN